MRAWDHRRLPATVRVFGIRSKSQIHRAGEKAFSKARFVCERVSQFSLAKAQKFDVVLAIGIVHHLDDAEAQQLFQIAYGALKQGGKLVTSDGVYFDGQSSIARGC